MGPGDKEAAGRSRGSFSSGGEEPAGSRVQARGSGRPGPTAHGNCSPAGTGRALEAGAQEVPRRARGRVPESACVASFLTRVRCSSTANVHSQANAVAGLFRSPPSGACALSTAGARASRPGSTLNGPGRASFAWRCPRWRTGHIWLRTPA